MFKRIDEERLDAESAIRLFLQLYPLFAAHFASKTRTSARTLAEIYARALDDEFYGDKVFVSSIKAILENPQVKKAILESEDE